MSLPTEHEQRFAEYLAKLAADKNRAALAALRRGLGKSPGEAAESHMYVVPWLLRGARRWQEDIYYLVASLFAWHQGSWRPDGERRHPTNLGASMARLAERTGSSSAESRFIALLNCHRDDLPQHLRQTVGLLKSAEIAIDWAQLLHDIQGWDWESRAVQRDWARAFWGSGYPPGSEATAAETDAADDLEQASES